MIVKKIENKFKDKISFWSTFDNQEHNRLYIISNGYCKLFFNAIIKEPNNLMFYKENEIAGFFYKGDPSFGEEYKKIKSTKNKKETVAFLNQLK